MIAGFADAGRVLKEQRYVNAAARAAQFALQSMRSEHGGLLRTWKDGTTRINAFLDDYALVVHGLLALNRATGDIQWLDAARTLIDQARKQFWDKAAGGYFDTLQDQSDLFVRTKSMHDGAVPCGNSVMVCNLLDLHEATGEQVWKEQAATTLQAMSAIISRQPTGPALATSALSRFGELEGSDAAEGETGAANRAMQVSVEPSEVSLSFGESATVTITLRIAEGMHINAHEPGAEFLIPLRVQIIGGEGLEADMDYPEGVLTAFKVADEQLKAYFGTVVVKVRLHRIGPMSERPQLAITYQSCTDKACLAPVTELLPMRIMQAK
jgi:uncharacterized protein YyaL (SSP411 family)